MAMIKSLVRCVLRVLKCILFFLAALLLFSTLIHQILTRIEKNTHPPIGDSVSVNGRKMSLYTMGSGPHTIVLLPGLGTTSPIYDFMPLAERLAENNRVVTFEPLGYGWSETTWEPRTVESSVEELRAALKADEVEGPYVLMPHSVAGLEALYYANSYPDEVEAVVGIDCTLPTMEEYFAEKAATHVPGLVGLLCPMGVMRWLTQVSPASFISDNSAAYYSEANLKMQRLISGWTAENHTVVNQMNHITQNMATTHDMQFSAKLPLLFYTQDGSRQKPREDGKTSLSFYETYISNPDCQQAVALNGHHYLHWADADRMAELTTEFLSLQLP